MYAALFLLRSAVTKPRAAYFSAAVKKYFTLLKKSDKRGMWGLPDFAPLSNLNVSNFLANRNDFVVNHLFGLQSDRNITRLGYLHYT